MSLNTSKNSANHAHVLTDSPFTEYEFTRAVYSVLENGDETRIAERIGKSVSIISQMYSPDCERVSNVYKAAAELAALVAISPERGCKVLSIFTDHVKRSLPKEEKHLSANLETGKLTKEVADVANARLAGLPIEKQLEEAREAKTQADRTYQAVYDEWVKASVNGVAK